MTNNKPRLRSLLGGVLRRKEQLSPADLKRSRHGLMIDGVCSTSMVTLQGGPFLAAFAIHLGAGNYEIGLLATIGFLSQFMQIPGMLMLRKVPYRRAIVVAGAGLARSLWVFIVLIPMLFAGRGVTFLMQWLFLAAMAGALAGPAWNSLIRDIVPQDSMGRLFSRRMILGTSAALVLTLGGGLFVDAWGGWFPAHRLYAYSLLFALGTVFGIVGLIAIYRLPEPTMPQGESTAIWDLLLRPWKDGSFRGLLGYIAVWTFAMNLAGPFFIVYLLERIGLSLGMVTMLVVISQVSNLVFLRIWGRLADRFSNKSVLSVSGPLFLLAILLWTFTTLPEKHVLTIPLLVAIHVLSGISTAGVSLASANIALKLSPSGLAHSYMTAYGMAGALAGAVAPMLGGVLADFFASRQMDISLSWSEPSKTFSTYALNLRALDFLFLGAFLLGLVALRFLRYVREQGEVEDRVVREELLTETFATFRVISTVPGLRHLVAGPVSVVHKFVRARRINALRTANGYDRMPDEKG